MDEKDGENDDLNKGRNDMQALQAASDEAGRWNQCLHDIACNRNRNSYREVFSHFAPLIKSYAFRTPSSGYGDAFAEELVQETMLKVWTKAKSFDASRASASTWIFTIARNTRIDLLRKLSRHENNSVTSESVIDSLESQDIWSDEMDTGDAFNKLTLERNRKVIRDSLNDLPPEQTQVLEQVFLEDKTHNEVAQQLGLPLGTVKSRVRLALKKMKISIDR